jgi:predicted nuclease of predicted toxin-antitoxin system
VALPAAVCNSSSTRTCRSESADALRDAGHEAEHVIEARLRNASDDVILASAVDAGQIIVTADTDFGTLQARSGASRPSVITLRSSDHLRPRQQADLVVRVIAAAEQDLEAGTAASAAPDPVRVRRLPIAPDVRH